MPAKFNQNGQWMITPATNPYDAVDNPEKYANKDKSYDGISTETDIEESRMRDIKSGYAKVFKDHEELKNPEKTSNEAVVPSKYDLLEPETKLEGIEKHPPKVSNDGVTSEPDQSVMKKNAGDLDWSELYKSGAVEQDPASREFAKTLPQGDVSNKGGDKVTQEELRKEAMDIVRQAHSTPGMRQPTDEELFGHLVKSEEEIKKAEKDWNNTINDFYKEANKPVEKQSQGTWAGRGSYMDELTEEERAQWNLTVGDRQFEG